jgi:FMN reductase
MSPEPALSASKSNTKGALRLLIVSASASQTSKSERLGDLLAQMLASPRVSVEQLRVRDLPPGPLLAADASHPKIADALAALENADGVVVITPTYKGSFTGLLKVFVDLLPQYALRGKVVLPLATGGTLAHVLMLDHGLRPLLQTMWPRHVGQGCFMLDKHLGIRPDGKLDVDKDGLSLLTQVVDAFKDVLENLPGPVARSAA